MTKKSPRLTAKLVSEYLETGKKKSLEIIKEIKQEYKTNCPTLTTLKRYCGEIE